MICKKEILFELTKRLQTSGGDEASLLLVGAEGLSSTNLVGN
jgi:hypothetical protein